MKQVFLDFEQPIAELSQKIEELRFVQDDSVVDISEEIKRLQKKSDELTKNIFAKLTPVQVSQVSRHAQRPYTLDYIEHIFTDFQELHGDRSFADDPAIVGGLARFNGQSVMVIGHQKDRLDMPLQPAVHERQLELVFKVRGGAQPAQQGACPALGGIFHGKARKRLNYGAWFVFQRHAGHFHPFFMAEQRKLGRAVGHGHNNLVKYFATTPYKAQVPVGQRIESAGVECYSHGSVQMHMRV